MPLPTEKEGPWQDFAGSTVAETEDGPWSDFAPADDDAGPWKDFTPEAPATAPEGIPLTSFPAPPLGSPGNMPFSPTGDVPGQPDRAFSEALFTQLPTDLGNVARAIPADASAVASLFQRPQGQEVGLFPSVSAVKSAVKKNLPYAPFGNIKAALTRQPLPIDTALAESAKESAYRGEPLAAEVIGQTSQGLAATAPLLVGIGILPKAAQAFASAGFSLDMIRHAPQLFKDYAEEINKPKEEQDADKISQLTSGIIQTFTFAPLAGAHAGRGLKERLQTARKVATELPIDFEVVSKSEPLPPTKELQNAVVKETEQAIPGVRSRNEVQEVSAEVGRSAADVGRGEVAAPTPEAVAGLGMPPLAQEMIATAAASAAKLRGEVAKVRYGAPGEIKFEFQGKTYSAPEPRDVMPAKDTIGTDAEASRSWALRQVLDGKAKEVGAPTTKSEPASSSLVVKPKESRITYRVPATGKQSRWIKTDNGWFRADSNWKPTTKKPLEPMGLRDALDAQLLREQGGREIITPENDTLIGKNDAGENLYQREDGAAYRMRMDRKDRPNGYPDFGGDLAPATVPGVGLPNARGNFPARSEAGGLGEQAGAPTVGDIRSQRATEAREAAKPPTLQSVLDMTPEQYFDASSAWAKEAMGGKGINVQVRAELAAQANPNLKAWQEAQAKASDDYAKIRDEVSKNPDLMADPEFQKKFGGAAQRASFFSEGRAILDGSKQPNVRTVELSSTPEAIAADLNLKYDGDVLNRQQFTIQDAGPANLAQFTVPKGATKAQIQEKLAATKARFEEVEGSEAVGSGRSFFNRQSEAQGLGEMSTRPTVEDVRRSREAGSPPPVEPPRKATPGTLSESERMRKLSERGTTSEKIPEPVQEQIKGSPESYYKQQSLSKVEDAVRGMSDAELGAVAKDSDVYTAAKLEQATRLFDSGNSEAGYRVFQDLSTELTRLGQVINQAKLFQSLRPEHVVTVVNKELTKAGKDPLTPEQAGRVKGVADARIKKQIDLDRATEAWTKDPTDANAVKAEKALEEANKAALAEQTLVNQFKPRSLPAILKSILQGNLLVPISHVANLVGNVNFTPFRSSVRTIASGIDVLDSYIRNRPREISTAPIKGTKASVEGLIKGVKQIPAILAKGAGEAIKGEARAGLHPLRAWVKQFAKNPDIPTVGGKIPFSERVNLAIEGTFGVPAEVMLRGLGAGDIAFSEMARSRLIAEQARMGKLSPTESKMAKDFPELFFDKATLDRINNETKGAVFQRHSKTLDHLLSWIKGRGDWFDLAVSFVAPYKLTPYNIVGEILSYNPLIAAGRTALEAKRGNIRAAETNAAKVLVGSALIYAGYWLYDKGLLSPSMDSKDEQQKARVLAGEVMPPNHINISGLKRALNGGDPAFKPGDETVDIFRGGGLAGSMFYMTANIGRDAETKPEAEKAILSLLKNSTLEQARFGLNQSFLKGVTGLLEAVQGGDADTYVQSLASTVLSIPLPNTLSAISRAEREYKVDAYDKNLGKQVENVVRTRLGFAGMDDYLPLKRGLWGEPLRETPENRNALVYHFFDISKNRQVTSDPVPLELYRLWRKTADTSVIPTPPDKTITIAKQSYLLNADQRSRYAELVGTARRNMVEKLVTNPEWHKLSDESKITVLGRAYDLGTKNGKAQFFAESGDKLEKKAEKAGFNP